MNNQKTFLAAFGVVLTVALIILGVSFSSLNSQTNNSKKVVADIKFENAYDFKVRLKSTDGSTFKLSSLPAKITITFADRTTEVIEKDIIKASGYERNYVPYIYKPIIPLKFHAFSLMWITFTNMIKFNQLRLKLMAKKPLSKITA